MFIKCHLFIYRLNHQLQNHSHNQVVVVVVVLAAEVEAVVGAVVAQVVQYHMYCVVEKQVTWMHCVHMPIRQAAI